MTAESSTRPTTDTAPDVADLPAGIDDEPDGRAASPAPAACDGQAGGDRRPPGGAGPRGRGRVFAWIAMAAIVAGALAVGLTDDGGPRTDGERARDLAATIACPTCDGQSVADSDSSAARNVRTFIERRIADGETDDQIRDELAARYGERILLTPGRSGLAGLVWVLPVAVLVAALAGVALAFRRWRGRGVVHASDADRELVDKARAASAEGR
jgi:cytochrome c-type biogenesis protein CcmH